MQETLTNVFLSFATQSSRQIKPSSYLYSSIRALMRGLVGVLSQTQQWSESLECECENVNDCENHEPKLHEMKNTSRNGYGESHT